MVEGAVHPIHSPVILPFPAMTMNNLFLAEKQIIKQTLVFQVQNK
jgi:hypothetical protein